MYLLKLDNNIIECENIQEIASYFKIKIKEDGYVYFNDKPDTISYNMKEYTIDQVYKDFIHNRLSILLQRKNITIYKANKL